MGAFRVFSALVSISCGLAISGIPAKAQGVSPCKVSRLSETEDREDADGVEGGLGHRAKTFAIRNRSSSLCVLEGVPTTTLADKSNRSLNPAYVAVAYDINDGAGNCREAATLAIHLRDQREPLNVNVVQGGDKMRSCGGLDITPFLAKPPVEGILPGQEPANPER